MSPKPFPGPDDRAQASEQDSADLNMLEQGHRGDSLPCPRVASRNISFRCLPASPIVRGDAAADDVSCQV